VGFFIEDHVDRRRRRIARVTGVLGLVALPYVSAIPAAFVFRAFLDEQCWSRLNRKSGDPILSSEVRFSWIPPAWRCEGVQLGGETVTVWFAPFGGD